MIHRSFAPLFVVVALGVLVMGCGDDSSSGSSGDGTVETSSLTKAQYIKQVNKICEDGSEKFALGVSTYLKKHSSDPKSSGEIGADTLRVAVLPEVEAMNEEIEELGAPEGDEEKIEAYLAAQQRSIESLEKRKSVSLNNLDPAFRKPGDLARKYGIESCAFG